MSDALMIRRHGSLATDAVHFRELATTPPAGDDDHCPHSNKPGARASFCSGCAGAAPTRIINSEDLDAWIVQRDVEQVARAEARRKRLSSPAYSRIVHTIARLRQE